MPKFAAPIPRLTSEQLFNFNRKIDKTGECWLWTDYRKPNGYGTFHMGKKSYYAHRVQYQESNDLLLGALDVVMHTCDNPSCVKPQHLGVGLHLDNVKDCINKERNIRGEASIHAKITADDVREIREASSSGVLGVTLAVRYVLSRAQISRIASKSSWKHLK